MLLDDVAFELLKQSPFYANLFRTCKITVDNKMKYAACVKVKNSLEMVINEDMFKQRSLSTNAGTLEHEFQHIMRKHIQQYMTKAHMQFCHALDKPESMQVFNYAVDAEINGWITNVRDDPEQGLAAVLKAKKVMDQMKDLKEGDEAKVALQGQLEEILKGGGSIFPEFFDMQPGESWQKYYIQLLAKAKVLKMMVKGQTSGEGDSDGNDYMMGEDHEYFKESLEDPDLIENIVYNAVKEAAERTAGKLPGEVGEFILEVEKKKSLPWVTILRQFVAQLMNTTKRNNWKKVNRRYPMQLPGFKRDPKLKILVGLDESGSFSDEEWSEAMNEIHAISKQGVEVWIASFDTQITNYYKFTGTHKPRATYGGTSFKPVHEKALSERFNAVIMLTDGFGDFADPKDVTYQSLWVMSSNEKSPYGVTIRLPNVKNR